MHVRTFLFLACAAALSAAPGAAAAQIYGGTGVDGTPVLSSFMSSDAGDVIVAEPLPSGSGLTASRMRPHAGMTIPAAFETILMEAGRQFRVDPALLHAMIQVESGYDPLAVSPRGARGLMQLMPDTARRFGVKDAFNPRQNIEGGARYLRWLLDLFNGDMALALAGYNAGEQAVIRAGYRIPPYRETRSYVPKVLARYRADPTSPR